MENLNNTIENLLVPSGQTVIESDINLYKNKFEKAIHDAKANAVKAISCHIKENYEEGEEIELDVDDCPFAVERGIGWDSCICIGIDYLLFAEDGKIYAVNENRNHRVELEKLPIMSLIDLYEFFGLSD